MSIDALFQRSSLCRDNGFSHRAGRSCLAFSILSIAISLGHVQSSSGNTILVDNFDDHDDEGWTHFDGSTGRPWGPGIFDASSGAYHLRTTGELENGDRSGVVSSVWDESFGPMYSDGHLRAVIRPGNRGSVGTLLMRADPGQGSAYVFGADPMAGNFYFDSFRHGRLLRKVSFAVPGQPVHAGEDWIVEAGTVEDRITMKAWQVGQLEPSEPQLELNDPSLTHGAFGVSAGVRIGARGPWQTSAFFDNIEFTMVGALPGDFDDNRILDLSDVNMLLATIRQEDFDIRSDLNSDLRVDGDDLRIWVKDLKGTWFGDANLDGEFSSDDMVAVFQAGKYELDMDAGWAEGDWTGDRRFGSEDMVAAFQDGGYERGPRIAAAAVPEPANIVMLVIAALVTIQWRRRTSSANHCYG